jgi:hypothetical protein
MRQKLEQKHELDDGGNPAGGLTTATGIYIQWQNGPLGLEERTRGREEREVEGTHKP